MRARTKQTLEEYAMGHHRIVHVRRPAVPVSYVGVHGVPMHQHGTPVHPVMAAHAARVQHHPAPPPPAVPVKKKKPKTVKVQPETEEIIKEIEPKDCTEDTLDNSINNLEAANVENKKESVVEIEIETVPDDKKSKMKVWPENPSELVPYSDIVNPLKDVLRKGYRLFRRDEVKSFEYEGFNIGTQELERQPSPRVRLTEKFLEQEKKLGYTLMDSVLNMMFLMGIEQGRRAERRDSKPVEDLLETLEAYREKNKDQRIRIDELEIVLSIKETEPNLSEDDFRKKVQEGMLARRNKRIEELKAELQLDSSRSDFQFKTPVRSKFRELETIARALSEEKKCTEDQWKRILEDRGWTYKEWKDRCKKKSLKITFS